MTPAARIAAAIALLDRIFAGEPAERALTRWARASRYAGSGDRRAVRDHVFDGLRRRRSAGWLGGGEDGRAVMIGLLRQDGTDPGTLFDGGRHAPPPLGPGEQAGRRLSEAPEAIRADLPDEIWQYFRQDHGAAASEIAEALRHRAPVHLRANLAITDRRGAIDMLTADGIASQAHPLASTAIEVTDGADRITRSRAWRDGLVELQDAASQAVVEALPKIPARVLDYCAGGGGKTLALAARGAEVVAHDAAPARMRDLKPRAARAKLAGRVILRERVEGRFDLVLVDAPCSGSGAWRRQPDAKWRLTAERLDRYRALQLRVLSQAAAHVAQGGELAYVTCSLIACENRGTVDAFIGENDGWKMTCERQFTTLDGGDGFYLARLARD